MNKPQLTHHSRQRQGLPLLLAATVCTAALAFISHSVMAADAGAAATPFGSPARKPNIIFIITDDQNKDTLGCFGGKTLTPNIDSLARDGVRFDRFYATTSVCMPSRYTSLTGQYASRSSGKMFLSESPVGSQSFVCNNVDFAPGAPNVQRVLQKNGYVTGAVGKWHNGFKGQQGGFEPFPKGARIDDPAVGAIMERNHARMIKLLNAEGFDSAAALYWDNLGAPWYSVEGYNIHNMEWVTKAALDFIDQNKSQPFFLYFSTSLLHNPVAKMGPYAPIVGAERSTTAGLLAEPITGIMPPRETIKQRLQAAGIPDMTPPEFPGINLQTSTEHILWLDDGIGALLKKLDELGLAEDTVIFFFSDNGTLSKFTCYELGVRTPTLMRWKGKVPAGQVRNEMLANIDFAPTILEIAGISPPADMHLDGRSFLPLVKAAPAEPREIRDAMGLEYGYSRAITNGRWKYLALRYPDPPPTLNSEYMRWKYRTYRKPPGHGFAVVYTLETELHPAFYDADQLYDLDQDPHEKKNLANDPAHAAVLAEMKQKLSGWLATFDRPFGEFHQP